MRAYAGWAEEESRDPAPAQGAAQRSGRLYSSPVSVSSCLTDGRSAQLFVPLRQQQVVFVRERNVNSAANQAVNLLHCCF